MRRARRNFFPLLLATLAAGSTPAGGQGWEGTLVRSEKRSERIEALRWNAEKFPVKYVPKGEDVQPVITIEGELNRAGWYVVSDSDILEKGTGEHSFTFDIPLIGKITPVEVVAIGPNGEVELERIVIRFEASKESRKIVAAAPPKRQFVTASLGPTVISYKETRVPDFSMYALTAKFSYTALILPPKWDFAANTFFTLLPLSSNIPDVTVRFLGINFRFGYVLQSIPQPWSVSLLAGYYYVTTFVSPPSLGFVNLAGPQFFPVVRRKFRNGDAAYAYLKFSPLTNGVSLELLNLSNRELAIGGGWSTPLANGHPFSLALDVSTFSFDVPKRSKLIEYSTFSLSAGYGL